MTDLNKKQAFWAEQLPSFKENYICLAQLEAVEFNTETGNFDALPKDATGFDLEDILEAYHSVNTGWSMWLRAKAQAVPETQQKLTNTYYWEGSDYVVDCPFEYDIELDKGEVLELQKWQRTESTKVYFANIYKDEDNFEILQFASKAEAENAVAENLKFLEASESGAEG
ncbi:hypothetical protein [Acinetobacter calcoaceticus]|uniref:hypothetical protein n=1 Tax=Acinetobacter calcoaceticus TaxID=471 RepID=UPI003AF58DCC